MHHRYFKIVGLWLITWNMVGTMIYADTQSTIAAPTPDIITSSDDTADIAETPSNTPMDSYEQLLNQVQNQSNEHTDADTQVINTVPPQVLNNSTDDALYAQLMARAQSDNSIKTISIEIVKQLELLSKIISDLSQILNNNQLPLHPTQKTQVRAELLKLGNIISQVRYSAFTVTNKDDFVPLIEFITALTDSLRKTVQNGLKQLFPVVPATQRSGVAGSPEQLLQQLTHNKNILVTLEKETPYVGLSTFNRFYHKCKKLNREYNIARWAFRFSLLAFGVAWAIYKYQPEDYIPQKKLTDEEVLASDPRFRKNMYDKPHYKLTPLEKRAIKHQETVNQGPNLVQARRYDDAEWNKYIPWYKQFLGSPPPANGGFTLMDDKAKGILTKLQYTLGDIAGIINFANPGYFALADIVVPYLKENFSSLYLWLTQSWQRIDNILKGQPHKKVSVIEFEEEINVTLDDVIGNDAIKRELYRLVAYVIGNDEFDRQGLWPVTGLLFAGATRTGKSFMAKGLAGTIQRILKEMGRSEHIRYFEIKASALISHGISKFFYEAAMFAPIIVFIDEIDTIGLKSFPPTKEYSELLTVMSDLNKLETNRVIVIGATNKPEQLADAMRAPGRFGMPYTFVYPTYEERKLFLKKELAKRALFVDDAVMSELARESEGYSFDALSETLRIALMDGKINGSLPGPDALKNAFNEHVLHIIDDKSPLPPQEQQLIATHQAGHALARMLLDTTLEVTKVTTRQVNVKINEEDIFFNNWQDKEEKDRAHQRAIKTTVHGYTFTIHKPHAMQFDAHKDLVDELTVALAGHAAERLLNGNTSHSYHEEDLEQAMHIAKRIVLEGIREKDLPKNIQQQKLHAAFQLIEEHKQKAYTLLETHKKELEAIIAMLFTQELLTKEQIVQIMDVVNSPEKYTKMLQELSAEQETSPAPAVTATAA